MRVESSNPGLQSHVLFKSVRLLFLCVLGAAFLSKWNSGSSMSWTTSYYRGLEESVLDKFHSNPDDHTIPTLLSVVNEETGEYLSSLENPIYDRFKEQISTENLVVANEDNPVLVLEPSEIRMWEPLRLTWMVELRDDDVLVLSCNPENPTSAGNVLDLATVAQAIATTAKHGVQQSNAWYFPSFPVLRRDECWFSLYREQVVEEDNIIPGERLQYKLLAASNKVRISDAQSKPTAIHLAYGSHLDEMVVQFKTGVEGTPIVEYGPTPQLGQKATGKSHTYGKEDMCHEPANQQEPGKFVPPGNLHVVTLAELEPDTIYWYRVAVNSSDEIVWSEKYSFLSAPAVEADAKPFKFLVYGDQGCPARGWGEGGLWISSMAEREAKSKTEPPLRAIHHFGDLSYAVGVAHVWDAWLDMVSKATTMVPLMVGVGNHEYDHWAGGGHDPSGADTPDGYHPSWGNMGNDSGGECGVPTSKHFTMPRSEGSNGVFWYSYDVGNVHTIMISSEHDLSRGSIQHQWLRSDLAAVDRSITPWVILEVHRPLYESEVDKGNYKVGVALRTELEDVLLEYKVDLVLGGHYHAYQRSCAGLYKSKCNRGGPTHITIGTAGAPLTHNPIFPNKWTEKVVQKTFGYGRITIANATAMHFELVQAGSADDPNAGKVLDEVWFMKEEDSLRQRTGVEKRLNDFALPSIFH